MFQTKTAARRFFHVLLNNSLPGDKLDKYNIQLLWLIGNHPECVLKIGCGIDYFFVMSPNRLSKCFAIKRTDGTTTDFSYIKCLSYVSPLTLFSEACRLSVLEDISTFRRLNEVCCVCKKSVSYEDRNVHHLPPPFYKIINSLISENRIDLLKVKYTETTDNNIETRFKDKMKEDFVRKYHSKHARLALLCKNCHKKEHVK